MHVLNQTGIQPQDLLLSWLLFFSILVLSLIWLVWPSVMLGMLFWQHNVHVYAVFYVQCLHVFVGGLFFFFFLGIIFWLEFFFDHTLPLSDVILSSVKSVNSIGLEDTQDSWWKSIRAHCEFCTGSIFLSIFFFLTRKKYFLKIINAYECK